eukprot:TRINITY_DN24467_c0_g1_i2.p1 TRINITY_DN24467_c0_g1~~TRINITY_DN24467_c0_g1_i2.p1  ORF type:complete len:459 (+),score=152.58 TRINITY_DN24467_c0_g1_i2:76-1452(+)
MPQAGTSPLLPAALHSDYPLSGVTAGSGLRKRVSFRLGTRVAGSFAGEGTRESSFGYAGDYGATRRWTAPDDARPRRSSSRRSFVSSVLEEYDRTPLLPRRQYRPGRVSSWVSSLDDPDLDVEEVTVTGTTQKQEVMGYVTLLFGVLCMSSVGSVVQQFGPVHGTLLGCWIAQGLHLFFLASSFMILSARADLRTRITVPPQVLILLAVTGLCSGVGSAGFTTALKMTSQTDAYLFNSFPPTFIMIARTLSGCPTFVGERVAVAVNLFGAYLNVHGAVRNDQSGSNPMLGDALALLSSATDALTIVTSKFLCTSLPTPVILSVITFFSAASQAVVSFLVWPDVTFDADPSTGVFGWASAEWVNWWLVLVTAFFLGQMCMLGSLNVLPSLVMSMGQTLQPVGATFVAVVITQQEPLPSTMSLCGGGLILVGCTLLAYSSRNHQLEEEDERNTESDDDGC